MIKQHCFKKEAQKRAQSVRSGISSRIVLDKIVNKAYDESMLSMVRTNIVIEMVKQQGIYVPVNRIPILKGVAYDRLQIPLPASC